MLTLRSSGPPPAGRASPRLHCRFRAASRLQPLSSNVRPHEMSDRELRKDRQAKVTEFRKERFSSVTNSAESALKSAFLVNGGGAVALLAFFGPSPNPARTAATTSLLATALLIRV